MLRSPSATPHILEKRKKLHKSNPFSLLQYFSGIIPQTKRSKTPFILFNPSKSDWYYLILIGFAWGKSVNDINKSDRLESCLWIPLRWLKWACVCLSVCACLSALSPCSLCLYPLFRIRNYYSPFKSVVTFWMKFIWERK